MSVVLETDSARHAGRIGLAQALAGLARQDYPRQLLEPIVVDCGELPDLAARVQAALPGARIIDGRGLTKYEMKNLGATAATGDVVAFTDGDCIVGRRWVTEIARSLAGAPASVVGVQGRTRLAAGPFNRQVSVLLYGLRIDATGRLALRIVSDNCAFRRDFIRRIPFEQATLATTPESILTARMAQLGVHLAVNEAMGTVHDYPRVLPFLTERAYGNGFCMMRARRRGRELRAWRLGRLGPLGPPLLVAGKIATDLRQIAANNRTLGLRWRDWIPFLPLALAYYGGHLAGGYGAVMGRAMPRL